MPLKNYLSHHKIVQVKSIICTSIGEILSSQYECPDYDILFKTKDFFEKVVVVPGDILQDIVLFEKNFYFLKLRISDKKLFR